MNWILVGATIFGLLVGLVGAYLAWAYHRDLHAWTDQCNHARIVVAYKNKVKINAPITEWIMWCNMLDKDNKANGRTVYRIGGTDVAIIKKSFVTKDTSPVPAKNGQRGKSSVQGVWSPENERVAK
jgi:hypothetical protein